MNDFSKILDKPFEKLVALNKQTNVLYVQKYFKDWRFNLLELPIFMQESGVTGI